MKKFKKIIGVLLVICLFITILPTTNVQAAKTKKYKLNYTKMTIYAGDSFTLYPKNYYGKTKYKTSNKKIATVDKYGQVKAKKSGKATITVTVGKQKLTCKVTVMPIPTAKDLTVKEYTYENILGDLIRCLIITNNSNETISVKTSTKAYDQFNNIVGVGHGENVCIGSNQTSILTEYFESTRNAVRFDTKYNIGLSHYKDILANMQFEQTIMQDKVILSAYNNNDYSAYFVHAYVLGFKNGKLTCMDETYLVDVSSSKIEPNESNAKQITYDSDCDYVEIYYTGWGE